MRSSLAFLWAFLLTFLGSSLWPSLGPSQGSLRGSSSEFFCYVSGLVYGFSGCSPLGVLRDFSGELVFAVSGNLWRELRGAEQSEAPRSG